MVQRLQSSLGSMVVSVVFFSDGVPLQKETPIEVFRWDVCFVPWAGRNPLIAIPKADLCDCGCNRRCIIEDAIEIFNCQCFPDWQTHDLNSAMVSAHGHRRPETECQNQATPVGTPTCPRLWATGPGTSRCLASRDGLQTKFVGDVKQTGQVCHSGMGEQMQN